MTTEEAANYFGNMSKLGLRLGLTVQAPSRWGKYPDPFKQAYLEKVTHGQLKAEPWVWDVEPLKWYKKYNLEGSRKPANNKEVI